MDEIEIPPSNPSPIPPLQILFIVRARMTRMIMILVKSISYSTFAWFSLLGQCLFLDSFHMVRECFFKIYINENIIDIQDYND